MRLRCLARISTKQKNTRILNHCEMQSSLECQITSNTQAMYNLTFLFPLFFTSNSRQSPELKMVVFHFACVDAEFVLFEWKFANIPGTVRYVCLFFDADLHSFCSFFFFLKNHCKRKHFATIRRTNEKKMKLNGGGCS